MPADVKPPNEVRREVLAGAISDIQGSLHANDSKASAALIVHGLLFTGVLTVTGQLGPIYEQASPKEQDWGLLLLGVSLLFFLISVSGLLLAVVPPFEPSARSNARLRKKRRTLDVLFPDLGRLKGDVRGQLAALVSRVEKLGPEEAVVELAFELLKVQKIRRRAVRFARVGYVFLGLEVLSVTAYLALVGAIATDRIL